TPARRTATLTASAPTLTGRAMTAKTERVVCPADQLAARAADRILAAAGDAIRSRGRFTLALSGGSTPEKTYAILSSPEHSTRLDWSRIYLFFGDHRFVPHDDPRSNCEMPTRSLLPRPPIDDDPDVQ